MRVWFAGHLRPVDTRRIEAWHDFYKLFAWGKLVARVRRARTASATRPSGRSSCAPERRACRARARLRRAPTAIVQWIDERTGRPYRGAADAALRHRRAGAFRRRVARLSPRGDPARARATSRGRELLNRTLEGSRHRAERPRGRARRPRPGRADARDHALRERRRDDDPGGRPPGQGAHRSTASRGQFQAAVDELQRRRQPDGVEGRGHLAALALRCGAGRRRGRPHRLRGPARGLPRLVQRRRNLRARAAPGRGSTPATPT